MLASLPIREADLLIRSWGRDDLDALARWPGYPSPYEAFNLPFAGMTATELERSFQSRNEEPDRITVIVDHAAQPVIGYFVLVQIDWKGRRVGNMGCRLHPSWCDRGIGTSVMRTISNWCFDCGMKRVRLDVAAANPRAIRCYEKAGFVAAGEFWRDDNALRTIGISRPEYDSLRPHVRWDGATPQVRFLWMELTRETR